MIDNNIPTSDKLLTRALHLVDSNPIMKKYDFIHSFSNEFANDSILFEKVEILLEKSLCALNDEHLIITATGQEFLERFNSEEYQIEKEDSSSEGVSKPYLVSKLKMEPKTLSIFQALRKIDKGEINLNPEFQRAFVWDEEKQSRLIESVLIRIPLPAFYLDATEQIKWQVVDGLQRLTTLHRFCRNKFQLKGLQFLKELNGEKFETLPAAFKILLEDDTSLQFYNLMPGTPIEAKYTIFSRVNTGGMQLTPQEIRHALTQGKVTKWLKNIAHSEIFIETTDGAVESRRMSDRELALRAMTFMYFGIEEYKKHGEMDSFLINSMITLNEKSEDELSQIRINFESSLVKVFKIFGKYSFRKFYSRNGRRSPLNKALFEAWIKCVSKYPEPELVKKKDAIIDAFIYRINKDIAFLRSISAGTGSSSSVETRFSTIENLLKEVMND